MTRTAHGGRVRERLRSYALSFPEAWEDHPWGDESVAKVGKKVFVFFGMEHGDWWPMVHLKLTVSNGLALSQVGVEPMGYGLGKSGWVSVRLAECELPYEALAEWVLESYCAVAPKKLVKQLDEETARSVSETPA